MTRLSSMQWRRRVPRNRDRVCQPRVVAIVLGVCCFSSSAVMAQHSVPSHALHTSLPIAPLAPFADPDSIGNIAAFTTLAQETPGECIAAMQLAWTEGEHEAKTIESDTMPSWEQLDTLPTPVHTATLACATPFTVATVPASQLWNLFQLAIVLGDTTTATAARERWLAAPPTLRDQNETSVESHANRLLDVLGGYWRSSLDIRLWPAAAEASADTAARHILQRLDALGSAAQRQQLSGWLSYTNHQLMLMNWLGRWDPTLTMTSVKAMLARLDAAPVAQWPFAPTSPLNPMSNEVARWIAARGYLDPHGAAAFYDSLLKASPAAAAITQPMQSWFAWQVQTFSQVGTPVAPLTGTYWFHPQGRAVWPQPGHVSVLMVVTTGAEHRSALWSLKRLVEKYGAHGFTVTLVLKTQGYWLKEGTHTGPISASEEAADDSAYFFDYLQLPFTVVVVPTPFAQVPDGRVGQRAPVPFETAYGTDVGLVLSDRTGHLVMKWKWSYVDEPQLDAYIARALKQ